jgi:hypothetical protein
VASGASYLMTSAGPADVEQFRPGGGLPLGGGNQSVYLTAG